MSESAVHTSVEEGEIILPTWVEIHDLRQQLIGLESLLERMATALEAEDTYSEALAVLVAEYRARKPSAEVKS